MVRSSAPFAAMVKVALRFGPLFLSAAIVSVPLPVPSKGETVSQLPPA